MYSLNFQEEGQNKEGVLGVSEDRVKINLGNGSGWQSLNEFRDNEMKLEAGKNYYYFISMTSLLSDLCMDRNYLAINPLLVKYPFELC